MLMREQSLSGSKWDKLEVAFQLHFQISILKPRITSTAIAQFMKCNNFHENKEYLKNASRVDYFCKLKLELPLLFWWLMWRRCYRVLWVHCFFTNVRQLFTRFKAKPCQVCRSLSNRITKAWHWLSSLQFIFAFHGIPKHRDRFY